MNYFHFFDEFLTKNSNFQRLQYISLLWKDGYSFFIKCSKDMSVDPNDQSHRRLTLMFSRNYDCSEKLARIGTVRIPYFNKKINVCSKISFLGQRLGTFFKVTALRPTWQNITQVTWRDQRQKAFEANEGFTVVAPRGAPQHYTRRKPEYVQPWFQLCCVLKTSVTNIGRFF